MNKNDNKKIYPHTLTLSDGTIIDMNKLYPPEKRYPLNYYPKYDDDDKYFDDLTEDELIKYGLK